MTQKETLEAEELRKRRRFETKLVELGQLGIVSILLPHPPRQSLTKALLDTDAAAASKRGRLPLSLCRARCHRLPLLALDCEVLHRAGINNSESLATLWSLDEMALENAVATLGVGSEFGGALSVLQRKVHKRAIVNSCG